MTIRTYTLSKPQLLRPRPIPVASRSAVYFPQMQAGRLESVLLGFDILRASTDASKCESDTLESGPWTCFPCSCLRARRCRGILDQTPFAASATIVAVRRAASQPLQVPLRTGVSRISSAGCPNVPVTLAVCYIAGAPSRLRAIGWGAVFTVFTFVRVSSGRVPACTRMHLS